MDILIEEDHTHDKQPQQVFNNYGIHRINNFGIPKEIVGWCGSPLGKGVPGVSVFIMVGVSRAVANKLQSKVIKAYPRLQVQFGR